MTVQGGSVISSPFAQNGSLLIQGSNAGGHAALTTASGFSNAGTITLQVIDNPDWTSTFAVSSGTLTNAAAGVINFAAGIGGTLTLAADVLNNGTVNANTDARFSKTNGVYTNAAAINIAAGHTLSVNGATGRWAANRQGASQQADKGLAGETMNGIGPCQRMRDGDAGDISRRNADDKIAEADLGPLKRIPVQGGGQLVGEPGQRR